MEAEIAGRVLVVGAAAHTNARVVEELEALGLTATGALDPNQIAQTHDARDFDVIVFARASLGRASEIAKTELRRQNPAIRVVEAIGPLTIRQVLGAVRHDPRTPRLVGTLDVEPTPERGILRAEVLAPCRLRLWLFRQTEGALTAETLAVVQVEPSIFTLSIPPDRMRDAYSFVAEADDDELVHFPVLGPSGPVS